MHDVSAQYKRYLLALLLIILAFNFVDRFALGVVLQDIKVDLALSDTQLGLMSGIAFALFYSVMGIPLARWADCGNRVTIISLTAALWGALVSLCGVAGSFIQLLLIRVGVGIGEAGCIPTGNSLIADYFERAERPRAAAIYSLGTFLGVIVGYFFAGWLNELYGWRVMFMLLGSPGLVLAVLAWFTLREPRRARNARWVLLAPHSETTNVVATPPSLKLVFTRLWATATFRHLLFGFSVMYFFVYGILQWQPAFFIRSYGFTSGELGTWFAVIFGVGGILGTWFGGEWAARNAANNERLQLRAMALTYGSLSFISPFIYLVPTQFLALGVLSVTAIVAATISGPIVATIQTLVPAHMRAMSFAIIFLFANLIGMGLGPLAAGALSDALRAWAGEESLRYALLVLTPGYCWAGWHLWQASRTVTQDIGAVRGVEPVDRYYSGSKLQRI